MKFASSQSSEQDEEVKLSHIA